MKLQNQKEHRIFTTLSLPSGYVEGFAREIFKRWTMQSARLFERDEVGRPVGDTTDITKGNVRFYDKSDRHITLPSRRNCACC